MKTVYFRVFLSRLNNYLELKQSQDYLHKDKEETEKQQFDLNRATELLNVALDNYIDNRINK